MTAEQRVYITVDEFLEVEMRCKHAGCEAIFSWPIEYARIDSNCPNCKKEWFSGEEDSRKDHLLNFMKELRELRNNFKGAKLDIRIRINPNAI